MTKYRKKPVVIEAVTQKENLLRGLGASGVNSKKTECNNGHVYSEETTIIRRGWRECVVCRREGAMRRYNDRRVLSD